MRGRFAWAAFVIGLVCLTAAAHAEKRVALVIGNSAYKNAPALKNPRNDAEDLAIKLKRLGFTVISGTDLDHRGMLEKVRDLGRILDDQVDVALFFYAGHGMQAKGQNYLVPVSAALKGESDLDFETIPLDLVLKQMQRSARVSLVFLDACRDNPLSRSLRAASRSTSVGDGLARVEETAGMMISFSTQPGNVALDGTGRNSPFTKALLNHIETPGATIGDMMIDVRKQVISETAEKQIPWENSSLTGKFYFNPGVQTSSVDPGTTASAPQMPPKNPQVDSAILDHTFWTSISESSDPALFREYLRRFPNGMYATIAESKLDALGKKVAMVAPEKTDAVARNIESPRQIAENMQRELKRVGCYAGAIDGSFGTSSRRALERFNEETKLTVSSEPLTSEGVGEIKKFPGTVCERVAQEAPHPARRQREPAREREPSSRSGPTIIPNIQLNLPIKKLF